MPWNDNLLTQQITAASHTGHHGRLLAGPGTGKTLVLTRRVVYLINERHVAPNEIVALTFTRAAARELRQRITIELGLDPTPRVSTLHSFALRQLLRNSHRITTLPQPLRIADDWEERHIILENLKLTLGHNRISQTKELFSRLASDWESLAADEPNWAPDPTFIGAWTDHRNVFGYTLRAELTYQLKRAIEQIADFQLDSPLSHLLVDEYQDLNRCDLAVIRGMTRDGVETFVAGDDDQSIYWFRKAHPDGIRQFPTEYAGAVDLPLEICKRCDPEILALAEFVAALDTDRIPKSIRAEDGRTGGEVKLLRFTNQTSESNGIAQLAKYFIEEKGLRPRDILVLLRVDTHGAYSTPLLQAFAEQGVPAVVNAESLCPLDTEAGRIVLSFLRLIGNPNDDLCWYQLLLLRPNRIGEETISNIYEIARNSGTRFSQTLLTLENDPAPLGRNGAKIKAEIILIRNLIQQFQALTTPALDNLGNIQAHLDAILNAVIGTIPDRQSIQDYLLNIIHSSELLTIPELISSLESAGEDIEQELEPDKVNIISMHKAKGLTASVVFIPVCEDEHIPGRQEANPSLGDERRLLFVSLTRTMHHLFISYCSRRTGQQRQLGRNSGRINRTLTRFLRDAPLRPDIGETFVRQRVQQ